MKWQLFQETWQTLQAENRWGRLVICGLLVTNAILAANAFTHQPIVTVMPPNTGGMTVTASGGDQRFREAWGLYLAELIGNITPGNVDFIVKSIEPMLSPAIYQETVVALRAQAGKIAADRVTMRFEPRQVVYEASTGKVFVHGDSYLSAAGGNEKRTKRTYEVVVSSFNYMPRIDHIETYAGGPMTEKVRERKGKEEAAKEKHEETDNGAKQ